MFRTFEIYTLLKWNYIPKALILGGNMEHPDKVGAEGVLPLLELLEGKLKKGETYIYVCQNKACKKPVKTVVEALKLMRL